MTTVTVGRGGTKVNQRGFRAKLFSFKNQPFCPISDRSQPFHFSDDDWILRDFNNFCRQIMHSAAPRARSAGPFRPQAPARPNSRPTTALHENTAKRYNNQQKQAREGRERPEWNGRFIKGEDQLGDVHRAEAKFDNYMNAKYYNQNNNQNNNNQRNSPGPTEKELILTDQVASLKSQLKKSQESAIASSGIIHRLEAELTRVLKSNESLLSTHNLPPKTLLKIKREIDKLEVVRSLRSRLEELRRKVEERDMHIEGVMRSANATGLMEMAAARDEYYREVMRLRQQLTNSQKDRANLSQAISNKSRSTAAPTSPSAGTLTKPMSPSKPEENSDSGGNNEVENLKNVIRAQHKRIKELKQKLRSNSGGKSSGISTKNSPMKKGKEGGSPSKAKDRAKLALQHANRVDLRGQNAARERVQAHRVREREERRRREEAIRRFEEENGRVGGGTDEGDGTFSPSRGFENMFGGY